MKLSYDKLQILLKKNRMSKGDLAKTADISGYAMGKFYRDEPVHLKALMNICKVFHCDIGDVVEFIEE